ncbi:MAG: Host attachment protein [Myxococcales bacterium]|nr:Host attachment protein [Myxococcales bacterium]
MKRACIAIVDASRARLYAYQHDAGEHPNEQLREVVNFTNPARQQRPSELFSTTGARSSPLEDPIDGHDERPDLDFAMRIVSEIDRTVREYAFAHVILVASPKMLGDLRQVDAVLHRPDLILDEIPRDLARLTSPQLHDHLARLKLIAPRARLAFAQRP